MQPESSNTPIKVKLPRGGEIVFTKKLGPVQVGIPPETIKDCMNMVQK